MHCYCLSQFYLNSINVINIVFPDGKEYCNDWLKKYTLSNSFVYLVAIGITLINIIVKTILRAISRFESPKTKTEEIFSSLVKMFIVSFVNTVRNIF